MHRTSYRPLRTTIGDLLPLEAVRVNAASDTLDVLEPSFQLNSPVSAERHPVYRRFWPRLDTRSGLPARPVPGTERCPLPPDAPFPPEQPALMLYGLASTAPRADPAEHWVEYEVDINAKGAAAVGGIVLAGCAQLPYVTTADGVNLSNFGLPREIGVSWNSPAADGFLDAERDYTVQRPNWHSGFHVLAFGPVRTTTLRLRLSTFPSVLGSSRSRPFTAGFLVPYLYVFGHREDVVYAPHVPAGLLAAWQTSAARTGTYGTLVRGRAHFPPDADAADLVEITSAPPGSGYRVYGAVSALGATRQTGTGAQRVTEFFCTSPARAGDRVVLAVVQARQNEASIAGVRFAAPKTTELPDAPDAGAAFVLTVYEADLPPGAEVLDRRPEDPAADYRVRLGSTRFRLQDVRDGTHLRFVRPSTARTLLFEFVAAGSGTHVLALRSLELIQSAQVTLAPRASHRVQLRHLNFRLIGPDLARSYDSLGEGAVLEVEWRAGAGRSEVVFRADSLLELIDRTGARLYRNGRGWEIVAETAQAESRSTGWRRRESGRSLTWAHDDRDPAVVASTPPRPSWSGTDIPTSFRSFGNQQIRTHTEQLGYQNDPGTRSVLRTVNRVVAAITDDDDEKFFPPPGVTANRLVAGFNRVWHDLPPADRTRLRTMRGIYNLNVPPHALALNYLTALEDLMRGDGDPTRIQEDLIQNLLHGGLLSGVSLSVGASLSAIFAGVNAGYNLGQQSPTASRIVQMGDTGSIQFQGTDAAYQYGQTLDNGFDDTTQSRRVLDRRREVVQAPDVMWQGGYVDIVTGRIALPLTLEALGARVHGHPDVALVVRCLGLNSPGVRTDIWFDIDEEPVRDDF